MLGRLAVLLCTLLVVLGGSRDAWAWIENRVTGAEARIEVQPSGKALVEHRVTIKTNGNERLREITIRGVDVDAEPVGQSYVIPAKDALSGSLAAAIPLKVERAEPAEASGGFAEEEADSPTSDLVVRIDSDVGLYRSTYQFVVRYETDLRGRGQLRRDGALVEIDWTGPVWPDGLDNARVTFFVPAAPVAPRAIDGPRTAGGHAAGLEEPPRPLAGPEGDGAGQGRPVASRYLSEVRRGGDRDEIELLRSYSPEGKPLGWSILVDQRALDPLPAATAPAMAEPRRTSVVPHATDPHYRPILLAIALALFAVVALLGLLKGRYVRRLARDANAVVPGWVPIAWWARALGAAALVVAGVALQLLLQRPLAGSGAVVLAALLSAHGAARPDVTANRRGPGRWLAVTEAEGLALPARVRGGWLDSSTRAGRALLAILLALVATATALLARTAPYHAVLVGLDSIVLLAIFGTGRRSALPPDLAVAPIPFLRRVALRLRRAKRAPEVKIVARIRIPLDGVDPDEVRLLVVPRHPTRGLLGLEVGLTYAVGLGSRVGFPEILLRLKRGSECEQAARRMARAARVTPGRKEDELVLAFSPRLPTTRMTADLLIALAARLSSRPADPHHESVEDAKRETSRLDANDRRVDRAAA